MRAVKLVHPSQAKTIMSEDDARRLRQAGWVELKEVQAVSAKAEGQRQFRKRAREKGLRLFEVWLPEKAFTALRAMQRPGENQTKTIVRLLCGDDENLD